VAFPASCNIKETRNPAEEKTQERCMGSVTNSLSGLSYLMQPGGPLSGMAAQMSPAQLQSAQPRDVVSLSMAALQTQVVDGLFGTSQPSQTKLPALPVASSATSPSATDVLPGVASADLTDATAQEQSAINNQALALQQVQGLFAEPASETGTTDVFA
jgi:hypothetical protein